MSFVFLQNQSSNFLHRDKLKKSSLHYNNVSLFSYPRKTVNSPLRRRFEQTSVSVICENRPLWDENTFRAELFKAGLR